MWNSRSPMSINAEYPGMERGLQSKSIDSRTVFTNLLSNNDGAPAACALFRCDAFE